jgi:hypothetical protein
MPVSWTWLKAEPAGPDYPLAVSDLARLLLIANPMDATSR